MRIHNRSNRVIWLMTLAWLAMTAILTWKARAGGDASQLPRDEVFVLAFAWLCGLAAVLYALRLPTIRVDVRPDRWVAIELGFVARRERYLFAPGVLPDAQVVEHIDGEGSIWHACELATPAPLGRTVEIHQGRRQECERVCARFNDALRGF